MKHWIIASARTLNETRLSLKLAAALSTLVASACATPQPGIEVRVQEIRVPVPVPCVERESIPAEPSLVRDQLSGDAQHDSLILASSALMLRAALREARAVLLGCVADQ